LNTGIIEKTNMVGCSKKVISLRTVWRVTSGEVGEHEKMYVPSDRWGEKVVEGRCRSCHQAHIMECVEQTMEVERA
jgi:hypothetical protein